MLLMVVGTLMIPQTVVLVPLFLIVTELGMFNSLWGVIIPGAATPTGVFLLRQYMITIPDEILDAARMDKASEWKIFWRIIIPLSAPAIAVLAILAIMWRWNDFLWALIVLTMIDIDHQLLPDSLTLPFMWLGLLLAIPGLFVPLDQAVMGAAIGYLSLWSFYWLFKLITGKEGMGYGDFKLLAALGAYTGWQGLPIIILLSSFVGAIAGILIMVIQNRGKSLAIPFGPYLAVAGWLTLLFKDAIITTYLDYVL